MAQGMVASLGRQVMVRSALWPGYEPSYTQLWACLCLQVPVDGQSGGELVEPSSGFNYARQYVAIGESWWTQRDATTLVYNAPVQFPQPTGPWGRPAAWALATESGGGELFAFGVADCGDVLASSTAPEIDTGGLIVRLGRTTL